MRDYFSAQMLRWFILFLGIVIYSSSFAQKGLEGKVIDARGVPVAGASVYINNSTVSSSSDKDGRFRLVTNLQGNIELVISSIGFQTQTVNLVLPTDQSLQIVLQPKSIEIEEVVVQAYDKDGWQQWGRYFTETFIGLGENAEKTKILNPDVLRFRYNKAAKKLRVWAVETLQIENKALGYHIKYDLGHYESDFAERTIQYSGYANYTVLSDKRSIRRNREKTYNSSFMKFVRSIYNAHWAQDGYTVIALKKLRNEDKFEADSILKVVNRIVQESYDMNWKLFYASQRDYSQQDIEKYQALSRQSAYINVAGLVLKESDIVVGEEGVIKKVQYADYLYIPHNNLEMENGYFEQN